VEGHWLKKETRKNCEGREKNEPTAAAAGKRNERRSDSHNNNPLHSAYPNVDTCGGADATAVVAVWCWPGVFTFQL
jgi:hypothetical protein